MSLGPHYIDQKTKHWVAESIHECWEKFESGAMTIAEMQALLKDFQYFPEISWEENIGLLKDEIAKLKADPALADEREQLSLDYDLEKLGNEGDEGEDEGDEGDYADYSEAEEVPEGFEN
jgi:hypothetical protein